MYSNYEWWPWELYQLGSGWSAHNRKIHNNIGLNKIDVCFFHNINLEVGNSGLVWGYGRFYLSKTAITISSALFKLWSCHSLFSSPRGKYETPLLEPGQNLWLPQPTENSRSDTVISEARSWRVIQHLLVSAAMLGGSPGHTGKPCVGVPA